MSEMNEEQRLLAETTEGMVVADAGPGTGKTFTVVRRYLNIIDKGIDPSKVLMITFTRNGAKEMSERISNELFAKVNAETDPEKKNRYLNCVKNVRASTFDALCLRIVMNSPDVISDFFGIKEILSRNVRLVENETLNEQFFERYYMEFATAEENVEKYGKGKNNILAIMSGSEKQLGKIINKLMSRGVIPKAVGWFDNGEKIITGKLEHSKKLIKADPKAFAKKINEMMKERDDYLLPDDFSTGRETLIDEAVDEDRKLLLDFVHDVYFGYIRKSISQNRLTFNLAAIFAFATLYEDEPTRNANKVDYLMVDEFQDTNELQMLVSLLILNKPNLCVVGDWKQSIYAFRFANMENIIEFEDRVDLFITKLNRDKVKRVPFIMQKTIPIDLKKNYRSSGVVLDTGFDTFSIPKEGVKGKLVTLEPMRSEEIGNQTELQLLQANSKEEEVKYVVSKIIEYITDPKYSVVEKGVPRRPRFKDIAVLTRSGKIGTKILDECLSRGVPAFFQGDLEIMSTREGKIALAWLRYINNSIDTRGLVSILADCGYPLSDDSVFSKEEGEGKKHYRVNAPVDILKQREYLVRKRRRPTDLLTGIFRFYNDLNPDITQSIVNVLSDAYDGSLMTISDMISIMEKDIDNKTKFDIDQTLRFEAVTIQTLHKSKGLEYPIVIIAGLNQSAFPLYKNDSEIIQFNDDIGIRLRKELLVTDMDGNEQAHIFNSWKWEIMKALNKKDPLEEIRLFFVGITRSKQYLTLTAGSNPSGYFKHFRDERNIAPRTEMDISTKYEGDAGATLTDAPDITLSDRVKKSLSVHDVMGTFADKIEDESYPDNNTKGKGKEYGEKVHKQAYLIGRGFKPTEEYPDLENVRAVLSGLKGSKLELEIKCTYPIDEKHTIKGIIDVLAIFDDHIEIHDYKTDVNRRYLRSYEAQLSIYAHCVREALGDSRPISAFVDFVSPDYDTALGPRSHKVEIITVDELKKSVDSYDKLINKKAYEA